MIKDPEGEQPMSMTTRNTLYEYAPIVAPAELASPLVPKPLFTPEPQTMAQEEALIAVLRRQEFSNDETILAPNDPRVAAASFRNRFTPEQMSSAQARESARLREMADVSVLVATPPTPVVDSPAMSERDLRFRQTYGGLSSDYVAIKRAA
jgi:hypothetical protein